MAYKNQTLLDSAYELFSRVETGDFEYVYRGTFTQNLSKRILSFAETNLKSAVDKSSIHKKIYFIMVEGLQNITRHQQEDELKNNIPFEEADENAGIFVIQKKGAHYYVTTGNLIKREDVKMLRSKLEQINLLDADQLKALHKHMLRTGSISERGGAGLGLIEMARKSNNKLFFDFKEVNDEFSYFYFQTEIPDPKTQPENTTAEPPSESFSSLEQIKKLHDFLNHENIYLSFNGIFNQKNVISLLSVIKSKMNDSAAAKKTSNIMVEMLQNIVKHGDKQGHDGSPGIFMLNHSDNCLVLTAGNFLEFEEIEEFKFKINAINELTDDELNEYYNKILLDYKNIDAKKTGLGLIDMRLKSDQPIHADFKEIGQSVFFTIQTCIEIKQNNELQALIIEGTEDTPDVYFEPKKHIFRFSNVSLPENAVAFYEPILAWLKQYGKNPNPTTQFDIDIEYLNTASSKQIFEMIHLIDRIADKSRVSIRWHYDKIDEDMLDLGLRFKNLVNADFDLIEYSDDE